MFGNPISENEIDNLLGAVEQGNPNAKKAAKAKLKQASTIEVVQLLSKNQRDAVVRRGQLSDAVKDAYKKDEVVDRPMTLTLIGKVSAAGGANRIVLVEPGRTVVRGLRDVGADGLPKDKPFFLSAMRMKAGVMGIPTANADDANVLVEFQDVATDALETVNPALGKGKMNIKVDGKELFGTEGFLLSQFTDTPMTERTGRSELGVPFWINDQKRIEIWLEFYKNIPQGTFIELILEGISPQSPIR